MTTKDISHTGNLNLIDHLSIRPPEQDLQKAPAVFSFKRKREIEIPWVDVLKGLKTKGGASISAIRHYFEGSWGIEKGDALDDARLAELTAGPDPLIDYLSRPVDDPAAEAPAKLYYRTQFEDDPGGQKATAVAVSDGVVLRHQSSGRHYRVITGDRFKDKKDGFTTFKNYDDFWEQHAEAIEVVFKTEAEATANFTHAREIDLRPAFIERRYQELKLQLEFATKIETEIAKAAPPLDVANPDVEAIEAYEAKVFRLRLKKINVERSLKRLQSQASDLGFVLFLTAASAELEYPAGFPEPQKQKVKAGTLYSTAVENRSWTTVEYKPAFKVKDVGWNVFSFARKALNKLGKVVGHSEHVRHSVKVTAYTEVKPRDDMAEVEQLTLQSQGKQVFLFENTPRGFVTSDGDTLNAVMARCDANEAFRLQCVIFMPVYESSITGKRALTHYTVFERPLKGISPTMLPRLSLNESLSYRNVWTGTELGELAAGINLAPEETRTVTVTKEYREETTTKRSSTSVFELSRSESSDLSSEMESQVSNESSLATEAEASAEASGSYMGFSAKGSAKAGVKTSLADFSKAINKTAKSAAQSLNEQNRQEVSTSSESTTSVTNIDVTEAKLRNVNSGRSLNLFFYRLYNYYKGGLHIDDLEFDVLDGVEMITGSGIYQTQSFPLKRVKDMLAVMTDAKLPFDLDKTGRVEFGHRILDAFYDLITSEYVSPKTDDKKSRKASTAVIQKPEIEYTGVMASLTAESQKALEPVKDMSPEKLQRRIAGFAKWLGEKGLKSEPLVESQIKVLSDALYMDSMVGAQAATEPYSEQMREQEVHMRRANVLKEEADAAYRMAQANQLSRIGFRLADTDRNLITGVMAFPETNTLQLKLKTELENGKWVLCLDDGPVDGGDVDEKELGRQLLSFKWSGDQLDWLTAEDVMSRISLLNTDSQERIQYVIRKG